MTEKAFSMTDAIKHGMAMTRKYLGFVAIMIVIFIGFEAVTGMLQSKAGLGQIQKNEVTELYRENVANAELLWNRLQAEGYIDESGKVLPKLDGLRVPSQLSLPEQLEGDRQAIFGFLQHYTYRLPFPKPVYIILSVLLWILDIIMQMGLIRITIMLSRDEQPEVGELFANGRYFIIYFLSGLCFGLAVLGGFLLLIIPGIILMVMLGMYPYFVIDQDKGPIEALKASRAATKGARWQLFLFGLLIMGFNILGVLCLFIGVLFTMPASCIAYAYVYDRLTGGPREEEDGQTTIDVQPA